MYTALISPRYADRIETAAREAGGFVARGLMARHPAQPDTANWFYALLPDQAPEDPEVVPYPADAVIHALEAERERYRAMARQHPDTLWQEAIRALDDLLGRLHQQAPECPRHPMAQTA
ncbi:hypothetical protein ACN2MM_08700 [Alkalilimnicola ehrlichii MLHE-1]|uniref:Uncharacterized protein n=1 Tax=Alkalilimnicola ehrlichii (strain ATCC BAA-1101 / DSM 17681 / MLHE-1) TaxID=187272 RepID=Q0A895_ALKEH|nr:hypothetical protein [Alkalilimnicola ehrlichii]ABI56942.1 hypothetical protein Mlg_1595 [Alkalilimnicola ehrlichii MLHE-1]